MKHLLIVIIALISNLVFGQVQNGLIKNSLDNFKINFYLTDDIASYGHGLYEYWSFIDFYDDGSDDYLLFDEKYTREVKEITTKVYKTLDGEEPEFKGERNETFNNHNQKILVRDIESNTNSEISIMTLFYEYDSNYKLISLKNKLYYKDNSQEEIEIEDTFFKHYTDSIIVYRKSNGTRIFFDNEDLNTKTKEPLQRISVFHIENKKIIKKVGALNYDESAIEETLIEYKNNGYLLSGIGFSSKFKIIINHNKSLNEIDVISEYYNDNKTYKTVYKYDRYKNITSIKLFLWKKNGKILEKPTLKREEIINYEYDEFNNWISREHKNLTKNIVYIFRRDITY